KVASIIVQTKKPVESSTGFTWGINNFLYKIGLLGIGVPIVALCDCVCIVSSCSRTEGRFGGPFETIIGMNLCQKLMLGMVGPLILLKSGSIFKPVFFHIQDEDIFLGRIKTECFPRNRKIFTPHIEEAGVYRKYGIDGPPGVGIYHQVFYLPNLITYRILHSGVFK